MRVAREQLIWMALVTLAEQVEQTQDAPPRPSYGVRLALAVLFSFSDGDREPFEDFWKVMRDGQERAWSETIGSYRRTSQLQTQLRGVMRAVGIEPTVATEQPLAATARKTLPPRTPNTNLYRTGSGA